MGALSALLLLPTSTPADAASDLEMVGGGILGGAAGAVLGGMLGYRMAGCEDDRSSGSLCGLASLFFGAALGESILLPTGIHLANQSQGDLGEQVLYSVGIGAAGTALIVAGARHRSTRGWLVPSIAAATVTAQLVVGVETERDTAREKERSGIRQAERSPAASPSLSDSVVLAALAGGLALDLWSRTRARQAAHTMLDRSPRIDLRIVPTRDQILLVGSLRF